MSLPFLTRLGLLLLTALTLACSDRANRQTAPQGECRIQNSTTTSTSSTHTFTERTTYDYDADGNLLKKTTTSQTRYLDAQVAKLANRDQTTTEQYTYDAQGYLQTFNKQFTANYMDVSGKPATETFSNSQTYTYANGRLASYTRQDVNQGKTTIPLTSTYDYDAAGNLLRLTAGAAPYGIYTWTFSQNKLMDYVEKTGTTETRPFVIEDGLVVSYTIPGGWRGAYTYDSQRRLTKQEEYVNGKRTQYYTQSYGEGKPAAAAQPQFKGFPVVVAPNAFLSNNVVFLGAVGLLTGKKQFFINDQTGQEQFFSETIITNQLNAQGFVASATMRDEFKNPQTLPQVVTATTTHTYAGCD